MTILFIYNSKNELHKKSCIGLAASVGADYMLVNMNSGKAMHEIFYEIRDSKADVIVSLDFAGLELRTEMNEPSLCGLTKRIAFLVDEDIDKYTEFDDVLSLAHFVYFAKVRNINISEYAKKHPNIPNIDLFPGFDGSGLTEWFEQAIEEMEVL